MQYHFQKYYTLLVFQGVGFLLTYLNRGKRSSPRSNPISVKCIAGSEPNDHAQTPETLRQVRHENVLNNLWNIYVWKCDLYHFRMHGNLSDGSQWICYPTEQDSDIDNHTSVKLLPYNPLNFDAKEVGADRTWFPCLSRHDASRSLQSMTFLVLGRTASHFLFSSRPSSPQ